MKIIFFNDKKLAHDLKEDKVSSTEKLFYLLFFLIGSQLLGIIFARLPKIINYNKDGCINSCGESFYWYFLIIPIVSLLIKGYGIILSYKINSKGDDKRFLERVMCLLFPIAIRMAILLIFIKFLVSVTKDFFVNSASSLDIADLIMATDKMSAVIVAVYFCLRLKESIKIASSTT